MTRPNFFTKYIQACHECIGTIYTFLISVYYLNMWYTIMNYASFKLSTCKVYFHFASCFFKSCIFWLIENILKCMFIVLEHAYLSLYSILGYKGIIMPFNLKLKIKRLHGVKRLYPKMKKRLLKYDFLHYIYKKWIYKQLEQLGRLGYI